MRKSSHKLSEEPSATEIFIIGIRSQAKDYMLSWALNENLGISLEKKGQIKLKVSSENEAQQKQTVLFQESAPGATEEESVNDVFRFDHEALHTEIFLIVNQGTHKWLVPEWKTMDYFLLFRGPVPKRDQKNILKQIMEIPVLTIAVEISIQQIPPEQRLLFTNDNYGTVDKNKNRSNSRTRLK